MQIKHCQLTQVPNSLNQDSLNFCLKNVVVRGSEKIASLDRLG
jgi:hypothetical protein